MLNDPQNDRVYAPAASRQKQVQVALERLLRTCSTFSKSLMVSMGVSKLENGPDITISRSTAYLDSVLIFIGSGVKTNRLLDESL